MTKAVRSIALVTVCLALVVPAVLLYAGVLPYRIFVVHTGSMTPTIPSRSAVVVREGVYHVGQVISFESINGVTTHRLIRRQADGTLVTKGDANRTADPGQTRQSQVIGGVVLAPRELGYWLVYLKNPAGGASVLLAIACVWLIFSIMGDLAERQTARRRVMTMPKIIDITTATTDTTTTPGQGDRSSSLAAPRLRPVLVLDTEPPARVWKAVPKQPLAFRCSRCEATFGSDLELRLHLRECGHLDGSADSSAPISSALQRPSIVWTSPLQVHSQN